MKSDLPLSADALLAERTRLEEELQASEDWCELLRLKSRKARGEPMSAVNTARLEMVLIDALSEDPTFIRYKAVCVALERLIRGLPPVPPPKAEEPRPDDDLTLIRGITPSMARRLGALDITSFEQIANWSRDDIRYVSSELDIGRQIVDQRWVAQAAKLVAEADVFEDDDDWSDDDGHDVAASHAPPRQGRHRDDGHVSAKEHRKSKGNAGARMPAAMVVPPVATDNDDDDDEQVFDDDEREHGIGERAAERDAPEDDADQEDRAEPYHSGRDAPAFQADVSQRFDEEDEAYDVGDTRDEEGVEDVVTPVLPAAANDVAPTDAEQAADVDEAQSDDDAEEKAEPEEEVSVSAPAAESDTSDGAKEEADFYERALELGEAEADEDEAPEDEVSDAEASEAEVSDSEVESDSSGANGSAGVEAGPAVVADRGSGGENDADRPDDAALVAPIPAQEHETSVSLAEAMQPADAAADDDHGDADGDDEARDDDRGDDRGEDDADDERPAGRQAALSDNADNAEAGERGDVAGFASVPDDGALEHTSLVARLEDLDPQSPSGEAELPPVSAAEAVMPPLPPLVPIREPVVPSASAQMKLDQAIAYAAEVARRGHQPEPQPAASDARVSPPGSDMRPLPGVEQAPPPLPPSYTAPPLPNGHGEAGHYQNGHAAAQDDGRGGEVGYSKVEIEEATVEIVRKGAAAETPPPRMVIRTPDRGTMAEDQRPATPIGRFLKALTGNTPR